VYGVYRLVIKDLLGVIYAPHKTFKRIAENPKYLAVAIIILLFVALQTAYYYSYYAKVNYEQTMPPVFQLDSFTTVNATQWTTTSDTIVTKNSQDYINQTFYGNSSLQFTLPKDDRISAMYRILPITLEQIGYTANCGSEGFTSLNMNIKQISPNAIPPQQALIILYTANDASNYFTLDITHMLSNNIGNWNNLTIPVGTSEWQSTGSPDWTEVTGLKFTIAYPTSLTDIDILLQGIFFRGQYATQTNALGFGTFLSVAVYSIGMQIAFQWIILAAISYLLLKILKANNVTWKPLIITIGYTLMALVIIAVLLILSTIALPTISSPYDLPFSTVSYSDAIINGASPSSQVAYEAIAAATSTFTKISTAINVLMYVLQGIFITFAVKAVSGCVYTKNVVQYDTTTIETVNKDTPTELSYIKCIIIAVIVVIVTMFSLFILSGLGVF
jgi:hypothetical protein